MPQTLDNLTQTWNNSGTTFTGIKYNVTDTASAANSLLMDLRVDGVSKFSAEKSGTLSVVATKITPGGNASVFVGSTLYPYMLELGNNGVHIASNHVLSWSSTGSANGINDLYIFRDAANTLAQRTGVNPQTFRIYNSYTDQSNFERAKIAWESNVLKIGTEKAGTGTARALELQTDGVTRLTIDTSGIATFSLNARASRFTATQFLGVGGVAGSPAVWIGSASDGVLKLSNGSDSDFSRLQFGGGTSSFPAIKRNAASLQARLADDSNFTNIQGKLTTDTAYTAGAPTADGYLVIYDSNGTAYKIPAAAV